MVEATDIGVFVVFLSFIIIFTLLFPLIFLGFGIELENPEPVGIYATLYELTDGNFLTDVSEWLIEQIPFGIGDIFEILFEASDTFLLNFYTAWSNVPNVIAMILLLPSFAGFAYSIIKVLPLT